VDRQDDDRPALDGGAVRDMRIVPGV